MLKTPSQHCCIAEAPIFNDILTLIVAPVAIGGTKGKLVQQKYQ